MRERCHRSRTAQRRESALLRSANGTMSEEGSDPSPGRERHGLTERLGEAGARRYIPAKSIPFRRMTAPNATRMIPDTQRTATPCREIARTRCRSACDP